MGLFFWVTWHYAYDSFLFRERYIISPWMPPIYPLKITIPVAAGLLVLQGISELLKSLHAVLRGRWQ
jgi:TRAP-type mannitol/chloroaromatic compound transport system permease small subunit